VQLIFKAFPCVAIYPFLGLIFWNFDHFAVWQSLAVVALVNVAD